MTIPQWYRSWPSPTDWAEHKLETRPHVVDNLPRILMAGQNYKTVSELNSLQTMDGWPDESFCMLEWDIALDPVGMRAFQAFALLEPREILVAPYRFHDTWICWEGNPGDGPSLDSRPGNAGDARIDSFGLGCLYLPRVVLTEFLSVMDKFGFTDGTFGRWYREKYGKVRITWEVHPQHVHDYTQP